MAAKTLHGAIALALSLFAGLSTAHAQVITQPTRRPASEGSRAPSASMTTQLRIPNVYERGRRGDAPPSRFRPYFVQLSPAASIRYIGVGIAG